MSTVRVAHAVGWLIVWLACGVRSQADTITFDDFQRPAPNGWSGNLGVLAKERPLSIAWDAERKSNVLCVKARYRSAPLFLTKDLPAPMPMWNCKSISFWYRLSTDRLSTEKALVCRLRTGPDGFADCLVATRRTIVPGRWVHAQIDLAKRKPMVNVYRSCFSTIQQFTFRLDGEEQSDVDFEFRVGPIQIEVASADESAYAPRITAAQPATHAGDVLVVRNSAACYYGVEQAAARLGLGGKVDVRTFRGLHFPIFGFPGSRDELLRYGLIVLVDVDPYVLTVEQARWIADCVASGRGLLVCGGPNTFGHAKDFKRTLADCLPVQLDAESVLAGVNREPGFVGTHPITAGIPPRLGRVAQAHRLHAKADAQTLLACNVKAEPLPVLAVGTYHRGRTAVLNAFPELGQRLEGDFFTSDFYQDLIDQTLRWLLRVERPVTVEQFVPPPRHMTPGEKAEVEFQVKPADRPLRVVCRCFDASREVFRQEAAVAAGRARLEITAPDRTRSGDDYRLSFELRGPGDRIEASRTCPLLVHAPVDAEIRFYYDKSAVAPRTHVQFRVLGKQWDGKAYAAPQAGERLAARARMVDSSGVAVGTLAERPLTIGQAGEWPFAELAWDVPDLCQGKYSVEAELLAGGRVVSSASRSLEVVDRLDRQGFFPIISIVGGGGGHTEDPAQIGRRVDDLVEHGFNTAAISGVRGQSPWNVPRHTAALRNWTEARAESRGMAVIYEYESYTNLRHDRPASPCVHSQGYAQALGRHVEPYLAMGQTVPRLLSIKVTDEPSVTPAAVEGCAECRRAWRERFGGEIPDLGKRAPGDLVARRRYIEFVRDYVAQGYQVGQRLKREARAPWDLLLTFCAPGYGYSRDLLQNQEDLLWWAATADRIDFDVYPYFYPVSDKIVFLQAHFCMDLMRNVAGHLRKPWGFYVELDDRNYPWQVNPVEASSECALTAIAHGADYLNTFIHQTFGTGVQSRPERWEHLGRTLRRVREAGPLLAAARPEPARLAMLFPYTHWQSSGKPWAPHHAHQLLLRAFGEADLLHEEVVRREGRFACQALALFQTDYLPDDLAERIARFVGDGGTLLCDRVPRWNERGGPCRLPAALFPAAAKPTQGVSVVRTAFGKGQTCFFSGELDSTFKAAVDDDDLRAQAALQAMVRDVLFARGLRPRVGAGLPDWEVGYRAAADAMVLTAVNHGSRETETRVTLDRPVFMPRCVIDGSGRRYALSEHAGGVGFSLQLGARCGAILYAYPSIPAEVRLEMLTPQVRRGERLRYRVVVRGADGSPARGQFVVPITVTDPRGQEHARYAPGPLAAGGVYTAEVPLAVNAASGPWRIVVFDRFADREVMGRFEVP